MKFLRQLVVLAVLIFVIFLIAPSEPKFFAGNKIADVRVTSPLVIDFGKPVEKKALNIRLYPDAEGSWQTNGRQLITEAVFYPKKLLPETDYKVVVIGTRNYFSKLRTPLKEFDFKTERTPELLTGTGIGKKADDLPVGGHLSLIFSAPNDVSDLEIKTTPDAANHVVIKNNAAEVFFDQPLRQGQFYSYEVIDRNSPAKDKVLADGSFSTAPAPQVLSMGPLSDHVLIHTPITISFDTNINKESFLKNFSVTPETSGSVSWISDHEVSFIPYGWQYATAYTYRVNKGVRTIHGGELESDIASTFKTIGHATVLHMSPRSGSFGVSTTANIILYFDQAVDRKSAEENFSVLPKVSGKFSWNGNEMIFNPAGLSIGTKYTVREEAGVKSINGLDMTASFKADFTTIPAVTRLNVPIYYQTYALSCEESSLRAILAYFGIYKSDSQVLNTVGYNPRNRNFATNFWDDPAEMFVGYVSGHQNSSGYGTHWGPIAKAARAYGRGATPFTGWSPSDLAAQIIKGHPVEIWGVYSSGTHDSWNSPDGFVGNAPIGEHTRVVVGFYGTVSNPTKFILNDPLAGQIVWTVDYLRWNWGWFNDAGVAVY